MRDDLNASGGPILNAVIGAEGEAVSARKRRVGTVEVFPSCRVNLRRTVLGGVDNLIGKRVVVSVTDGQLAVGDVVIHLAVVNLIVVQTLVNIHAQVADGYGCCVGYVDGDDRRRAGFAGVGGGIGERVRADPIGRVWRVGEAAVRINGERPIRRLRKAGDLIWIAIQVHVICQ